MFQDTLKSPPAEDKTMKNATLLSIIVTTVFYLLCGCMGYAAFGDNVPGNLLTGFGFYNPYWLLDIANLAIVVHLVGAYQVIQSIVVFSSFIIRMLFAPSSVSFTFFSLNTFAVVLTNLILICQNVLPSKETNVENIIRNEHPQY